jgi:hypothetical protein
MGEHRRRQWFSMMERFADRPRLRHRTDERSTYSGVSGQHDRVCYDLCFDGQVIRQRHLDFGSLGLEPDYKAA